MRKKMRKLLVFISAILMLISTTGSSQSALYWIKAYGDTADEEAYSIKQTIDGGYIVAGNKSIVGGKKDILVLKLDSNGNVDWQKIYDKNDVDEAFSIQSTADGGYIVAGNTESGIIGFNDVWILKLNDRGDILWQKTYGRSENDDYARAIQQTTDGGYIVVGGLESETIWVFKLNSQGDVLWEKDFGNRIYAKDISQTADGGYIVLGAAGYDTYAQLVIRLDSNGDISWTKSLARVSVGFGLSYPSSIIQTANGEYIVLGKYINYEGVGGVSIIKLDSNGNLLWQMLYGDHSDKASSIMQAIDGGYSIVGTSLLYTWVLKLNSTGGIEWQKTYNESDEDCAYSIQQTIDGEYIVAGYTESPSGDKDVWILKLDSFGDIPDCTKVGINNAAISNFSGSITSCCSIADYPDRTVVNTNIEPQETFARMSVTCCSDMDDHDCDGIPDDADNCPDIPNPNQADSYPPAGNEIGDVCDCEGNFDCDKDTDGIDAANFKPDFGRNSYNIPCESGNPCNGDFDCDNDCDGTDAAKFKEDFGRNEYNNPCPACEVVEWCEYIITTTTTTTTTTTCTEDWESCIYSSECCNGCCCSDTGVNCFLPGDCQCVPTFFCEDIAGEQCQ